MMNNINTLSNKLFINWNEVINDISILITSLQAKLPKNIDTSKLRLIIPCRGGEIIWSLVKNSLGLREKQIYRIKFSNLKHEEWKKSIVIKDYYDYGKFLELIREKDPTLIWIFVDDLVDSGLTIDYIRESLLRTVIVCVLYSKEWKNKEKTDICVKDIEDKWIIFPWEIFYKK